MAAAGLDLWQFDSPPDEELGPVWGRVPTASREEGEQLVIGEIFGRLNTTAALPRLREACEEWRPDVVLRESAEFASALAAELHGVSHARVATGLSAAEAVLLSKAAPSVDAIRRKAGLSPDPDAEVLRRSPYLTMFPTALEDPGQPAEPHTLRFADPAWEVTPGGLPDWWDGASAPLVYVSFGSVAGGLEMAAGAYRAAVEAMEGLDARVLLTVGRAARPERLLLRSRPTCTSKRGYPRPTSSRTRRWWCATAGRAPRWARWRPAARWWWCPCSPTSRSTRSAWRRPARAGGGPGGRRYPGGDEPGAVRAAVRRGGGDGGRRAGLPPARRCCRRRAAGAGRLGLGLSGPTAPAGPARSAARGCAGRARSAPRPAVRACPWPARWRSPPPAG